jgi:4-amino-4-deoxy-L-arabinose transferase-like glycosyltransferase
MSSSPTSGAPSGSGDRAWLVSLLLFAGAASVRLLYLRQARANPLYAGVDGIADSVFYHELALEVSTGTFVGTTPYYLGPLYHHVMGGLYALFGPNPEVVRIFQCLLGAATCVIVYWIGRRAFSDAVGLLAGCIFALYGPHIYYAGIVLPATLVAFLNLAFLLVMIPGEGGYRWPRCLAGGLLAGTAALAKANALLLVPAALVGMWLSTPDRRSQPSAACSAALILGAILALTPAVAHNHAASGEFVLTTTSNGRNLWKGNGPYANGSHVFLPPEPQSAGLRQHRRGEVSPGQAIRESRRLTRATRNYVIENPGRSLRLLVKKLVLFFNAVELGVRDHYYFAKQYSSLLRLPLPSFGMVVPLGLLGFMGAWRRRPRGRMVHLMIATQVVSFTAVFVLARYRMVAVACFTLLASHQALAMVADARARRWRPLGVALVAWLALGIGVNRSLEEFPEERGYAFQYRQIGHQLRNRGDYGGAILAYRQALGQDWQDKSRFREEFDTRLLIAKMEIHREQLEAAAAIAEELRAELEAERAGDDRRHPVDDLEDSLIETERMLEASRLGLEPRR